MSSAGKRTLRRAGIRLLRFHDLRHCHASLLIAAGENIKTVSARLGHASTGTTMDLYAHLLPQADRAAARRMDVMLRQKFGRKAKDAG